MKSVITACKGAKKTLTSLSTGVLGWGTMVVTSKPEAITSSEWLMLGVVLASALGVYSAKNAG